MKADFGAVAEDYARHRAGFPDSLFERLAGFGIGRPEHAVLDLGTGTGSLARGFAKRGCRVVGLDRAEPLLEQARELDAREGRERRVPGRPGRGDGAAGGLLRPGDRRPVLALVRSSARAAAEAARLLRADGHLVIAHFDWLPLTGNVVRATEALIEKHNPEWSFGWGSGVHPRWLRDLGEAGYRELETFSYDVAVPYGAEAWRGRIRASAGVGGSLSAEAVERFDAELAALLAQDASETVLEIPHRVFAVVAKPPVRR